MSLINTNDQNSLIGQNPQQSIDFDTSLTPFDNALLGYIEQNNLPTENVLVSIDERLKVFQNFPSVCALLKDSDRENFLYVSKYLAAVSAGLFDAALNYLWDETISQLRNKVSNYDLDYFFDVAVGNDSDVRKNFKSKDDIPLLSDDALIHGARNIDLLSEIGFKQLDFIRYMRNWASAAHPNQTQLTGLQMISWLETCIREIINLPDSTIAVVINKFLKNIKNHELSEDEISAFKASLDTTPLLKINALAEGIFGIYCRNDTKDYTKRNIIKTFPKLWDRVDESIKNNFGIKYARYETNGDKNEAQRASELINLVKGQSYLPESVKTSRIDSALDGLMSAHINANNFYNEPPYAYQLSRLIGEFSNSVPEQLNYKYVYTIVYVFLTNGIGTCWASDAVFKNLIKAFNQKQDEIAVGLILNESISSKLRWNLCQDKFNELLDIITPLCTNPNVISAINLIKQNPSTIYGELKSNKNFVKRITPFGFKVV